MTAPERVYPGDEVPYTIEIRDDVAALTDPDILKVHVFKKSGTYAVYVYGDADAPITKTSTGLYTFTMSYPYEKEAEGKWYFDTQALRDDGTPVSMKVKPFVENVYATETL